MFRDSGVEEKAMQFDTAFVAGIRLVLLLSFDYLRIRDRFTLSFGPVRAGGQFLLPTATTLIADCRLPIADCRLPIGDLRPTQDYTQASDLAALQSAIGNRKSAML